MPINAKGRFVDETATPDERTYATFMHLSTIAHAFVPLIAFLIPLIMWLNKKDESAYIADHGREAVNFQISLGLYNVIAGILAVVLIGIPFLVFFIPLLGLVGLILASIAANRGELYRYPMTVRFISGG